MMFMLRRVSGQAMAVVKSLVQEALANKLLPAASNSFPHNGFSKPTNSPTTASSLDFGQPSTHRKYEPTKRKYSVSPSNTGCGYAQIRPRKRFKAPYTVEVKPDIVFISEHWPFQEEEADGILLARTCSTAGKMFDFETLSVTEAKPFVFSVELNRPEKLNAMNNAMWIEIGKCFTALGDNPDCRVVILSGAGKIFTAGLDFRDATSLTKVFEEHSDVARRSSALRKTIKLYQDSMTSLEVCPKPVISAVHGACVGGGINLITAADIRLCSSDAWFQVKEVDIGMAPDVGVLQRLPKVIGSDSLARELCYTARKMLAPEAKECGLVSKVYDSKESMMNDAVALASEIASKSPVAVQLTKRNLVYSRDHSVQEGLDQVRDWNMTMLQSEDFMNAVIAQATKSPPPTFSKL